MEDAGAPVIDGLGIAVHLVDMLPTIPIHMAFHSSTPGLTSFMPEVYAAQPCFRTDVLDLTHMPAPQSDQKVLDVLREEIIKNMGGASNMAKAVEPVACFSMAPFSTTSGKAGEVGIVDGPPIAHAHHAHHILWASVAGPSLSLHGIILKVYNPVHLPLAPVPDLRVCQEPVVQAHHYQDPVLDLMPAPESVQKVAVLVHQFALALHPLILYCCRAMMMIPPQLEKRMQVTQMMRRLCHKVLCHCPISLPLTVRMLTRP